MKRAFLHRGAAACAAGVVATAMAGVTMPFASAAPAGPRPVASQPLSGPTSFVVLQGGTGTSHAVAAVKKAGGTVVQEWPEIGVVIASATDGNFDDKARKEPGIVGAGPTRAMSAYTGIPQQTATGKVQGLGKGTSGGDDTLEEKNADQWDMRQIGADKAHLKTDGNRKITVGVLDSGIQADHPDLAANVDASQSVSCINGGVPNTNPNAWQSTTSGHGTHVAGTIAGARNGKGIVGVAPNVKLASVKVVDDDGYIYPEYAICGFVWAANKHMSVTNNSYYVDPFNLWCKANEDERPAIEAVNRALKYSEKNDVVNVAASGNSGWDLSKPVTDTSSPDNSPNPETRVYDNKCYDLPSMGENTVTVASVGPTQSKSYFSNYGTGVVQVAAPGGDSRVPANTPSKDGRILSTIPGSGYGYMQGTSMASPHVAGVLALLRGAHTNLNAKQAIKLLEKQATPLPCPTFYDANKDGVNDATCEGGASGKGYYGAGLVNAYKAVTE